MNGKIGERVYDCSQLLTFVPEVSVCAIWSSRGLVFVLKRSEERKPTPQENPFNFGPVDIYGICLPLQPHTVLRMPPIFGQSTHRYIWLLNSQNCTIRSFSLYVKFYLFIVQYADWSVLYANIQINSGEVKKNDLKIDNL